LGESDPDHATMAVSLGISMIANIKEVRYVDYYDPIRCRIYDLWRPASAERDSFF